MDNSTPNMQEKLVQYLDGFLPGIEKENLERELAADPSLREELNSLEATRAAIKLYGLHQKVAGVHAEMMNKPEAPARKMNPARRMLRYGVAVAASVILIVGGIMAYNFYSVSPVKVFNSNYRSYELNTLRDADSLEVSAIEKAYRAKEYEKLTSLYTTGVPMSAKDYFLTAMSWSEQGNSSKAIETFKKALAEDERLGSTQFKEESEYYLALNYVRHKEYAPALDLLRKIKDDKAHLYHEKVTAKLIRQVKILNRR